MAMINRDHLEAKQRPAFERRKSWPYSRVCTRFKIRESCHTRLRVSQKQINPHAISCVFNCMIIYLFLNFIAKGYFMASSGTHATS